MFKLASFNVNSIRARMDIVISWLEQEKPDVLCLQETKVEDKDFPVAAFNQAGYNVAFKGQKAYNGVAVVSPHPILETGYEKGFSVDNDEARLLAVSVNGVQIINSYIPQGQDPESDRFAYKLNWIKKMREFFENHYVRDELVVWSGDFNVAPEPIDVYDPERLYGRTGFHPEEHKVLKYVKEWGFIDVFRRHVKEGGHYTFWDYRIPALLKHNKGWRIDHIWATKAMAERSQRAWIDTEPRFKLKPSDHTFIAAEFKL